MLVVLLLNNTVFLLNLYVQSLGFYLQNLIKLGFHTDAFEQLGTRFGAPDRGGLEGGNTDGPSDWMQSWTVGTLDWKTATLVFLGILLGLMACLVSLSGDVHCTDLARSNCETVPDGHHGCPGLLLLPLDHHLWGGRAGLRMEREAAGANLCCHNLSSERLASLAELPNLTTNNLGEILCEGVCNPCSARCFKFYRPRKASGCLQICKC